jgi:hypothetical protein
MIPTGIGAYMIPSRKYSATSNLFLLLLVYPCARFLTSGLMDRAAAATRCANQRAVIGRYSKFYVGAKRCGCELSVFIKHIRRNDEKPSARPQNSGHCRQSPFG